MFLLILASSFLYDNSVYYKDAGIYANMAKEMLNGRVLYRDVFDIKGPFIFFIYTLIYLFPTVKIGVYIIDSILYTLIFFTHYKTIRLRKSVIFAYSIILVELMLLPSMMRNILPDSFALLAFSYINYWILSKQYLNPTKLQLILCGILTGLVFWIKFSLGVPIAIIYFYVIYNVFKNKLPGKINYFIYPLIGFIIPTVIVLGYFIYHEAISDLIHCYFVVSSQYKMSGFDIEILNLVRMYFLIIMIMFFLIYSAIKEEKDFLFLIISYTILIVPTFLIIKVVIDYYFVPFLAIFPFFSLVESKNKYLFKIGFLVSLIFICMMVPYNYSILKEQNPQSWAYEQFAKDVNYKVDSATSLYVGMIDMFGELEEINYKYLFVPNLTYEVYPRMWDIIYEDVSNKNIEYLIFISAWQEVPDISKDFKGDAFFKKFFINGFSCNSEITKDFIIKINEKVIENYELFHVYDNYVVLTRKQ